MKDLTHIRRFNESEENLNISDVSESKKNKIYIAIGKYALGLYNEKKFEELVSNCKFYIKNFINQGEKNSYIEGVSDSVENGDYILITENDYNLLRTKYLTRGKFLI
jgi:hypothetical protein